MVITPTELAERIKADIVQAVLDNVVPADVAGFACLHDFCDANTLGGTEQIYEELGHEATIDLMNPAIDEVDAWIKSGGIARGVGARLS